MRVFCDFDGTISVADTTDLVLGRFAAPAWQDLEAAWVAGRISAADCMREQVALIDCDQKSLEELLDTVELAPGFAGFVAWCEDEEVDLKIVSDGVDRFIRHILVQAGFGHLPVVANKLAIDGGWRLIDCEPRPGCAGGSGVCKCSVVAKPDQNSELTVYIGDGRSDFCVSARADILFAKEKLAQYARSRGRAHHEFVDFHEIKDTLSALRAGALAAAV